MIHINAALRQWLKGKNSMCNVVMWDFLKNWLIVEYRVTPWGGRSPLSPPHRISHLLFPVSRLLSPIYHLPAHVSYLITPIPSPSLFALLPSLLLPLSPLFAWNTTSWWRGEGGVWVWPQREVEVDCQEGWKRSCVSALKKVFYS